MVSVEKRKCVLAYGQFDKIALYSGFHELRVHPWFKGSRSVLHSVFDINIISVM